MSTASDSRRRRASGEARHLWVFRALLLLVVALTLGPLVAAGAGLYSPHHRGLNDLFEFFYWGWVVELMAMLGGAPLVWRLKDARKQEGSRALRAELLVARLAFWSSLSLSLVLPCAIAWVWMMGFAMLS
jgi:hypothetical protein